MRTLNVTLSDNRSSIVKVPSTLSQAEAIAQLKLKIPKGTTILKITQVDTQENPLEELKQANPIVSTIFPRTAEALARERGSFIPTDDIFLPPPRERMDDVAIAPMGIDNTRTPTSQGFQSTLPPEMLAEYIPSAPVNEMDHGYMPVEGIPPRELSPGMAAVSDVFSLPGRTAAGVVGGIAQGVRDMAGGASFFDGGVSEGFKESFDPDYGNWAEQAVKSPVTLIGGLASAGALPALTGLGGAVASGLAGGAASAGAGLLLDPENASENALMDVGLGAGLPLLGPALGAAGRRMLGGRINASAVQQGVTATPALTTEVTNALVTKQGRLPLLGTQKPADVALSMRSQAANDLASQLQANTFLPAPNNIKPLFTLDEMVFPTREGIPMINQNIQQSLNLPVGQGGRTIPQVTTDLSRVSAFKNEQKLLKDLEETLTPEMYREHIGGLISRYADIPELTNALGALSENITRATSKVRPKTGKKRAAITNEILDAMDQWQKPVNDLRTANVVGSVAPQAGVGASVMDLANLDVGKGLKSLVGDISAPKALRMLDTYGTPFGVLGAETIREARQPDSYPPFLPPNH